MVGLPHSSKASARTLSIAPARNRGTGRDAAGRNTFQSSGGTVVISPDAGTPPSRTTPQERVSLVQGSRVPEVYLANALSPARVNPEDVKLLEGGMAQVNLSPNQMGKAYGRGLVNLKLAQQLTGWNIKLVSGSVVCNV